MTPYSQLPALRISPTLPWCSFCRGYPTRDSDHVFLGLTIAAMDSSYRGRPRAGAGVSNSKCDTATSALYARTFPQQRNTLLSDIWLPRLLVVKPCSVCGENFGAEACAISTPCCWTCRFWQAETMLV